MACTVRTSLCGDAFILICLFTPNELLYPIEIAWNNAHEQDEDSYLLQILNSATWPNVQFLADGDAAMFVNVADDDGMIHM